MEENNDVFLVDGDVLVYLIEPMHKKYFITFAWGYPFSAYVSYNRFFNPLPLYPPVHNLDEPLRSPSCVRTSGMAYFSTKKQIRTFEYRID